jgi:RNA polymerase sigma-70 factor (ECF subfamily)
VISLTAPSSILPVAQPAARPTTRICARRRAAGGAIPQVGQAAVAPQTGARRLADLDVSPAEPGPRAQDALVLAIARHRDREAFIGLYEHYAPRLKSYLMRLGGADAAEEMAQEAMLVVWRKAALFDPQKAAAGTWIFTIARNLFIDRKRKERRPEIDFNDPMLVVENDPAADTALSARQTEQLVRAALSALTPEQAQVIELSFFEDKPHSAIAAELKLPLGTVKSRLRLAFARLRSTLGDKVGEPE